MDDVILLSDSDDIECLTPAPIRRNIGTNKANASSGATVHISSGTFINLEELGIARQEPSIYQKSVRNSVIVPTNSSRLALPQASNVSQELLNRSSKRPSTSYAGQRTPTSFISTQLPLLQPSYVSTFRHQSQTATASVQRLSLPAVSDLTQQRLLRTAFTSTHKSQPKTTSTSSHRTRNSQNSSVAPIYEGHYMFEATEGFEPSRRSLRFNTKKIEGKFLCSYNSVLCNKLFGSSVDIINHLWSHVICDLTLEPARSTSTLDICSLSSLKNSASAPLAQNSTQALEKMRTCQYCLAKFFSLFQKQQHVSLCHTVVESVPTTCNICEVNLENPISFKIHMLNHTPGDAAYTCKMCKYRTSVRKFFYEHYIEKHSNDFRSLLCPICLYHEELSSSNRRSKHIFIRNFVAHMHLHATSSQFRCMLCALSFNNRKEMEIHHSQDHIPVNQFWQIKERPSLCRKRVKQPTDDEKITTLQKKFSQTTEGLRINEEAAYDTSQERLGYDLTAVGNTLYKCECGFNSWNGNRIATHFHHCRKAIQDIHRERVMVESSDPADELEMFAVYPKPTETEKKTEEAMIRSLTEVSDSITAISKNKEKFEKTDDLWLLKFLSSNNDRSAEIVNDCMEAVLLNEEEE